MPAARRRHHASGAFALAVAGLLLAGCFKPSVKDGGFQCAPTGKACPDGFQCGADNRCERMPVTTPPQPDSGTEAGTGIDAKPMTEAGGETGSCTPVTPLCADGPTAGEACSPSCQRGCECG